MRAVLREETGRTRRYSQRLRLSCILLTQAARQPQPWLIFNVRQKPMHNRLLFIILAFIGCMPTAKAEEAWVKGPSRGSMEFMRTPQGRIYVPVEIKGRRLYFLVDTGGTTLIDLTVAKELGFHPTAAGDTATTLTGGGGERHVVRIDVSLGKFVIGNIEVSSIDLTYFKGLEKPELVGIIGADLLSLFRARIDYGDSLLTLHRPK